MEENPLPQDSPVTPSKSIQRFQYSLRTLMELTLGVAVIMAVSTWKFDPSNHIAECFGLLLAVLCCYAILKKRWMLIFFVLLAAILFRCITLSTTQYRTFNPWIKSTLQIVVREANTSQPIPNASIVINSGKGNSFHSTTTTDIDGKGEIIIIAAYVPPECIFSPWQDKDYIDYLIQLNSASTVEISAPHYTPLNCSLGKFHPQDIILRKHVVIDLTPK